MAALSLLVSLIALGLSIFALVTAMKNKGEAVVVNQEMPPLVHGAQLAVNLIKMPSDTEHGSIAQDYRFWITNVGTGAAQNVSFAVDLQPDVLFPNEVDEKLPVAIMGPGERLELCTRIGIGTPKEIRTMVYWNDADGLEHAQEFWVSKEVQS